MQIGETSEKRDKGSNLRQIIFTSSADEVDEIIMPEWDCWVTPKNTPNNKMELMTLLLIHDANNDYLKNVKHISINFVGQVVRIRMLYDIVSCLTGIIIVAET